jgi:hypothetical protein
VVNLKSELQHRAAYEIPLHNYIENKPNSKLLKIFGYLQSQNLGWQPTKLGTKISTGVFLQYMATNKKTYCIDYITKCINITTHCIFL